MKYCLTFSFLALLFINCFSQDVRTVLKEADSLEAIPNEKAAFQKFKDALKLDPINIHALTKCSELCTRIGAREPDTKSRDAYFKAAVIYGSTAVKLYPQNDEANVVMGIAMGRTILTKSGKEKISGVKEIKNYAENALKINPNNFKAWHIIGKWNFELSNLSFIERAAARIFYGGLPDASLKASIAAYERARALNPYFLLNYLELAKAYKKNDEEDKAIPLLKTLMGLRIQTEDDPRIKVDAASMLKKME